MRLNLPAYSICHDMRQFHYCVSKKLLEYFWKSAERFASEAKAVAECRNETLLIYFATDDTFNLRHIGEKRLAVLESL